MTAPWGPALDAEVAYRHDQLRGQFGRRRHHWFHRIARVTSPNTARTPTVPSAATTVPSAATTAPSAAAIVPPRAVTGVIDARPATAGQMVGAGSPSTRRAA